METTTPAAGTSPAPTNSDTVPPANTAPANDTPVTPQNDQATQQTPPDNQNQSPAKQDAKSPTMADVMSALKQDERRQLATGAKTLKQIIEARGIKVPDQKPEPTAAQQTPPASQQQAQAPHDDMPDRFRFKEPADQAIALIAKSKGVSLLQASKIYEAEQGTSATPAAQATPQQQAPDTAAQDTGLAQYDAQIAEIDAKVKTLSAERTKAREDVEMEKADSLSDQIGELRAELKLLGHERNGYLRNRETAKAQSYEQTADAARDRALSAFPELQAEGSMPRLALDAYVGQQLADPKRAQEFRNDPTWPDRVIREFASKYGIKTASAATAHAQAQQPQPAAPQPANLLRSKVQQVPGAKLVNGADGQQPSSPGAPTMADLQAALPRMNPAQRMELIRRASQAAATKR
jgi:hypothetical protein